LEVKFVFEMARAIHLPLFQGSCQAVEELANRQQEERPEAGRQVFSIETCLLFDLTKSRKKKDSDQNPPSLNSFLLPRTEFDSKENRGHHLRHGGARRN